MKRFTALFALMSVPIAVAATNAAPAPQSGRQPTYTVAINVTVNRTTKAINYKHRDGSTKIDFQGTALMPAARGEASVESKQGYISIDAEFRDLQSATRFGPEFLTYVMWTITPEGRAANIGEVILNGSRSKLDVTTELQAFGLIVTAEPYYGVTQPSDVVVMENVVRRDTVGKVEEIDAKYELLQRGQYTLNVPPSDLQPIRLDKKTPLDLYEARNAVRIARWAGAETSASESYQKASKLLEQAETYNARKAGSKPVAMAAREAVQTAEDARLITMKNQASARLEQERAASAGREATANADAAAARADANDAARVAAAARAAGAASAGREATANADAAAARADANDANRVAAAAQAQAERTRLNAQADAQLAADDARALAERTKTDADLVAQRSERDKADAEAASKQALKAAGEQSEREKQELRGRLVVQLNLILQTHDSARGLIVNMSDVLFDPGQFLLKSGAREKLAKISGVLLVYPSLKLEVEGYTDSIGSDDRNMTLSENRAGSVRDFLVHEGIVSSSIASRGFGEGQPVATNDTASGRQQNRRVELIVSGDVIGTAAR